MPKRCGHLSGKSLVEPEVMAAKIRAAVAARRDPDFVIIARTDARGVNGFDDAVRRASSTSRPGPTPSSPRPWKRRRSSPPSPRPCRPRCSANMTEFGKGPLLDRSRTSAQMGYAMVLYPLTAFRAAMKAAEETLRSAQGPRPPEGRASRG